jgi:hypothetical protein
MNNEQNLLRKNLYFNHEFYAAQAHSDCPEEDTPQCGIPGKYFELHIGKPALLLHPCAMV